MALIIAAAAALQAQSSSGLLDWIWIALERAILCCIITFTIINSEDALQLINEMCESTVSIANTISNS